MAGLFCMREIGRDVHSDRNVCHQTTLPIFASMRSAISFRTSPEEHGPLPAASWSTTSCTEASRRCRRVSTRSASIHSRSETISSGSAPEFRLTPRKTTSVARTGRRPILSGASSPKCYNPWMHNTPVQSASSAGHDRSLLEWFATLTPEQRLAELESRIGFFLSLRSHNDSQLSRDTRASQ